MLRQLLDSGNCPGWSVPNKHRGEFRNARLSERVLVFHSKGIHYGKRSDA